MLLQRKKELQQQSKMRLIFCLNYALAMTPAFGAFLPRAAASCLPLIFSPSHLKAIFSKPSPVQSANDLRSNVPFKRARDCKSSSRGGALSKIAKVTRVTRVEVEERGHKYPSFCKDLKFPLELKHFEFDGVYEMMQL